MIFNVTTGHCLSQRSDVEDADRFIWTAHHIKLCLREDKPYNPHLWSS